MDRPDLDAIEQRALRQPNGRIQADLLDLLRWVRSLEAQMRARAELELHHPLLPFVLGEKDGD